ncbi:AAA family ATPase [Actinoallomurus iriomotensis]|uniref:AAA family ATPase n=1 Tax=Actinoallomurus TaxID=667113 RepID=UPI0025572443|nr:AAA family ATPase [Actinoallomurus iriomotensis]
MNTTAPNLVVAGGTDIAHELRGTGRFPAVFNVFSASELRALSRSGRVRLPAAFVFAPRFAEDVDGAGVAVLANGLADIGFRVVVHDSFVERGDRFGANVRITGSRQPMPELLALLGAAGRSPLPLPAPASDGPPGPLSGPRAGGRVIATAAAKGGVGRTSLIVNLAVHAARSLRSAGRTGRTVLLDTSVQKADVGRYLNVRSPTILDLLHAPGPLSPDTVRDHLAHVPDLDLYALLGPPDLTSADPASVGSAPYLRIIALLREVFDYVFIDTPVAEPHRTTLTDLILREADAVLVPVEPSRPTLETIHSWLERITMPPSSRGGGVAPEKLSLILNRARADVGCGPEEIMRIMDGWRFVGRIPHDREWTRAVNGGKLVASNGDPELDAVFGGILRAATEDPVFATAMGSPNGGGGRRRGIIGLPIR